MNKPFVALDIIIKKLKRDRLLRRLQKNEKFSFTSLKRKRINNIVDYE